MPIIDSKPAKLRIRKRRSDGFNFAKQPTWERFNNLKIVAGDKMAFDFTDYIKNVVQGAKYLAKIGSDFDGAPITDP